MDELMKNLSETAEYIKSKVGEEKIEIGLVLGSGLGDLADEIENAALSSMNKEISTSEIGEKVLMGLWKMDEVAYIRFASVYRQFRDINTFMDELSKLLTDKK